MVLLVFFFFKHKTAYEMRISDWSSDVCSSDLVLISAESVVGGQIDRVIETHVVMHERPVKQKVIVQCVNLAVLVRITEEMRQEPATRPELFILYLVGNIRVIVGHSLNQNIFQRLRICCHLPCCFSRLARIDRNDARCILKHLDDVFEVGRVDRIKYRWKPRGRRKIRLLEEGTVSEYLWAAGDAEPVAKQQM